MAGLDVIKIVEEPIAAALSKGIEGLSAFNVNKKEYWMTYDFGGGTLDTTILEVSNNKIVTKAFAGDNNLGGIDIDSTVFNHFAEEFMEEEDGEDLSENPKLAAKFL